jgi:hypothetical protein
VQTRGLFGYRTNHSLRATAASRLYDEQVDEQLICEVTGHRSNAVRNYKRTTDTLKRKVNAVVQGLSTVDSQVGPSVTDEHQLVTDHAGVKRISLSTVDSSSKVENKAGPSVSSKDQVSVSAGAKNISLTLNFNL